MAVVLPGKFVFLATMHTGSMSVAYTLKELPGATNVQDKAFGIGHHASLSQVREVVGNKMTGTETVFTFVRNPYDLLVTWYLREAGRSRMRSLTRMMGHRPTLTDFIRVWAEEHPDPYFKEGRIFYHAQECNQVLRYERGLTAGVNSILRKLGVPSVEVKTLNATPDKDHWSLYYDQEAYTLANEAFKHDFVEYGYQFLWG